MLWRLKLRTAIQARSRVGIQFANSMSSQVVLVAKMSRRICHHFRLRRLGSHLELLKSQDGDNAKMARAYCRLRISYLLCGSDVVAVLSGRTRMLSANLADSSKRPIPVKENCRLFHRNIKCKFVIFFLCPLLNGMHVVFKSPTI